MPDQNKGRTEAEVEGRVITCCDPSSSWTRVPRVSEVERVEGDESEPEGKIG